MNWTEFPQLASSTGYILLIVVLVWVALGLTLYWAFVSGATSMGESVKFKYVEDDDPISQ